MSIRYILILDILETMDVVKVPRIPCSFCEGTFLVKNMPVRGWEIILLVYFKIVSIVPINLVGKLLLAYFPYITVPTW